MPSRLWSCQHCGHTRRSVQKLPASRCPKCRFTTNWVFDSELSPEDLQKRIKSERAERAGEA